MEPPKEIPPVGHAQPVSPLRPKGALPEQEQARPADRVVLSQEGRFLLALRRRLQQAPDGREDLVRSLRRAVQEGRYRPAPQEVARHLLPVIKKDL